MPLSRCPGAWLPLAVLTASAALPALADDVREGERVFRNHCFGCHALQEGVHRAGPSLFEVIGRPVGGLEDFDYSTALDAQDFHWDAEMLDAFLADPEGLLPGNRMVLWGLDEAPRQAVIRYLEAQQEAQ
ncbi:cytochrome c [Franzmannia pantelleriensis]|uniref:Cytochrome c n=1 Tax=Franzmannia pantelleriensis TaxID=48727 RepID=A0A1G9RRY5_9GAMM|nr:c-type cytochrome [Halomonas pantelleriensis]SDM25966.1 cytochrome c [Halomonas pantelleriensis]